MPAPHAFLLCAQLALFASRESPTLNALLLLYLCYIFRFPALQVLTASFGTMPAAAGGFSFGAPAAVAPVPVRLFGRSSHLVLPTAIVTSQQPPQCYTRLRKMSYLTLVWQQVLLSAAELLLLSAKADVADEVGGWESTLRIVV